MQDLCDKKFAHGLPVAVLPPIMLLGPHLEDDDLGSFEVLNDLRLDSDIVQVWPPHLKLAIILQRKHPWEADSATWLRLPKPRRACQQDCSMLSLSQASSFTWLESCPIPFREDACSCWNPYHL